MNQILVTSNITINRKNLIFYLILFFCCISICIFILIYLLHCYLLNLNKEKQTHLLKSKYNIITLYPLSANYTTLKLSNNISVIGLIEIPKINISYPIIENTNKDLLKISVCRFSGPFPNRIGNLCIAGHNYKNNSMFSNLSKLLINDSIYITDLNNTKLEYIIYDKFKVRENNLDCIKNTNNIEITLITCNSSNNSERIVIKAKMKG